MKPNIPNLVEPGRVVQGEWSSTPGHNEGLFRVRMYTSLGQILRGWNRIFFGAFRSLGRLALVLIVLIAKGLTCYAATAVGWGLYAAGASGRSGWLALAIVGTVGWFGINTTEKGLIEIAEVRLPSIHGIGLMMEGINAIKAAERTALIPGLSSRTKWTGKK